MYATDWGGEELALYCFFSSPPSLVRSSYWRFPSLYSVFYCPSLSAEPASCSQGVPPFQISFGNSMRCSCRFSAFAIVWGEGRVLFLYYAFSADCAVCCVLCIQYTLRIALCTQYSAVPRCGSVSCFFLLRHAKLETRN